MRRREFIAGIGGTVACTFRAKAQQPLPTVGFVNPWSAAASRRAVAVFREGLGETGYVEDRNVTVEYHWLDNQFPIVAIDIHALQGLVVKAARATAA